MPNCYYVTSSAPGQTARDLRACVDEVRAPGRIERPPLTNGARVHSWVKFDELGDAMRYLNPIKECMEGKGHRVHKAEILHEFGEVGLSEDE